MTYSKSTIAAVFGCVILLWHVLLTGYLMLIFQPTSSADAPLEITVPMTLTYAVSVVKWLIDTQGRVRKYPRVGIAYLLGFSIVVLSLFAGVILVLYQHQHLKMTSAQLNAGFAFVEATLGVLLVYFWNDLFKITEEDEKEERHQS